MKRELNYVRGKKLSQPLILYVDCNDDDQYTSDCDTFFAVSEKYILNVTGLGESITDAVENFGINMLDHYHNLKISKDEEMTVLEIMERTLLDTIIGDCDG